MTFLVEIPIPWGQLFQYFNNQSSRWCTFAPLDDLPVTPGPETLIIVGDNECK